MSPSAETTPAADEQIKPFGPNLATDRELAEAVGRHIYYDFFVPYWNQMQPILPDWRRADAMWGANCRAADLDIAFGTVKPRRPGASGITAEDGVMAKITPAEAHKQMDSLLNIACSVSLKDGVPVALKRPKTVFEHPLYNPTEQAELAANDLLRENAEAIDIQTKYRTNYGAYVRYGFAWGHGDLCKEEEPVYHEVVVPADQMAVQQAAQQNQDWGQPELIPNDDGTITLRFCRTFIKRFETRFEHLDPDAVLIDQLIPCRPIERQPCPIVRTHATRWDLEINQYDPQLNPMGWVGIEEAIAGSGSQFALSAQDESAYVTRLSEKFGISDTTGSFKPKNSIKQLYTCYAMLSIDPQTGQLFDDNRTLSEGEVRPKSERYVVQMYGSMEWGSKNNVLRIQRNPTAKDKVPLFFASMMPEDTTGATPISKSKIAWGAFCELAKCRIQILEAKEKNINRPWKKKIDGPAWLVNCNEPDAVIPFDIDPNEAMRVEGSTYDETTTLLPHIQYLSGEVKEIFGVSDSLMGIISPGRRAAAEMVNVFEASKVPLIVVTDAYNRQIWGGWAQMVIDNVEAYGDRDWIKRMTGRTTFGRLQLIATTAEEYVKKIALVQNAQYLLQATATDPAMQSIRPDLYAAVMEGMGLPLDRSKLDGGLRKAQQDAFTVLSQILGDGVFVPPEPTDPHQIYVDVFQEALKDPYWKEKAPQNIPILAQRLMMQMQLLMQQQMLELQQAQQPEAAQQPARPGQPPQHGGEDAQRTLNR